MGASQRTKGHTWERTVTRDLTDAEGADYRRVLTETRDGNQGDVEGGRFRVQCKAGASPPFRRAMAEAIKSVRPGETPLAAIHLTSSSNATEKYAVLRWSDMLELIAEIEPCSVCPRAE